MADSSKVGALFRAEEAFLQFVESRLKIYNVLDLSDSVLAATFARSHCRRVG